MVNRHRDPGVLPLSHARDMAQAEQDAERTAKELRELREFLAEAMNRDRRHPCDKDRIAALI